MQRVDLFDMPTSTPINPVDEPLPPLDLAEISYADCRRLWLSVLHSSVQAAMVGSPASSGMALERLRDISHARMELLDFATNPDRRDNHTGFVVDCAGFDRMSEVHGVLRLYRRNWDAVSHSLSLKQQGNELYRYVAADGRSFFCPKPLRTVTMTKFMEMHPNPGERQRW
ncbi:hypothetical protein [Paracoccus sp. KR1-242]|uniref:hypothetical protein n=1 Tax=Paracoccus sp. KR1-242 TaxID=3410028 RepID=UPI003C097F26